MSKLAGLHSKVCSIDTSAVRVHKYLLSPHLCDVLVAASCQTLKSGWRVCLLRTTAVPSKMLPVLEQLP